MIPVLNDIKSLPVSQKAELYYLLQDDEELKKYLFADNRLLEELARRDQEFAEGKMPLTTRKQLSNRLQSRRDGL